MIELLKASKSIWILLFVVLLVLSGCSSSSSGDKLQNPVTNASPSDTYRQSFAVGANQLNTIRIPVSAGDRLAGSFTIQGSSGNDIIFTIKDPSSNTVSNGSQVTSNGQFDIVCASKGSYQLVFDNHISLASSKAIALTAMVYH
jgi:hypothetical protein